METKWDHNNNAHCTLFNAITALTFEEGVKFSQRQQLTEDVLRFMGAWIKQRRNTMLSTLSRKEG